MTKHTDPAAVPTVFNFALTLTKAPYAPMLPGGEEMTTFWQDFQIANHWGKGAVKDTFDRAFSEWRHDVRYLIELVFALNHMCWEMAGEDDDLARLYADLYEQANGWAYDNLTGDDLTAYFQATD